MVSADPAIDLDYGLGSFANANAAGERGEDGLFHIHTVASTQTRAAPIHPRRERSKAQRAEELEELRVFAAGHSRDRALQRCGVRIRKGRGGSAREILEIKTSCRRKWLCPTCGYKASRQETAKLKARLRGWASHSGSVGFLTLTQTHRLNDDLAMLWSRLESGWTSLKSGSGWREDSKTYGIRGYVRVTEVIHHPVSGWNPHFHICLLTARYLGPEELTGLEHSVGTRFLAGVKRRGGHAELAGQKLAAVPRGNEGRLAAYCFKGTKMSWSKEGVRTPMAILKDFKETSDGIALWEELASAVTEKTRKQVVTSSHIDRMCL